MKQLQLLQSQTLPFHGGALSQGKRKDRRPLNSKKPLHLVLKADKGINLFHYKTVVRKSLEKYGVRFGIKIYGLTVQSDHVHLLARIHSRQSYISFIRTVTGRLARVLGRGLWRFRPFTRIVEWGQDYRRVTAYLEKNESEVLGLQAYQSRPNYYAKYIHAKYIQEEYTQLRCVNTERIDTT